MQDVLGWIANGFVLTGWWAMGRQRRWAPLCSAAGSLLWAVVGLTLTMPSLYLVELTTMALALRSWWLWRTDQGKPEGS